MHNFKQNFLYTNLKAIHNIWYLIQNFSNFLFILNLKICISIYWQMQQKLFYFSNRWKCLKNNFLKFLYNLYEQFRGCQLKFNFVGNFLYFLIHFLTKNNWFILSNKKYCKNLEILFNLLKLINHFGYHNYGNI